MGLVQSFWIRFFVHQTLIASAELASVSRSILWTWTAESAFLIDVQMSIAKMDINARLARELASAQRTTWNWTEIATRQHVQILLLKFT